MGALRKWLRLRPQERWLLVWATLTVGVVRLGLWALTFQSLRGLLAIRDGEPARGRAADPALVEAVVWAVTLASRYVPRSRTCLTQALAVQSLLGWRGHPTVLRIGVAKEGAVFRAHAWVESQGRVILGGLDEEFSRYTPLPPLAGPAKARRRTPLVTRGEGQ
jgi:Transglutaminase-like superfamily